MSIVGSDFYVENYLVFKGRLKKSNFEKIQGIGDGA
jgi:hypothetical protein